MSNRTLTYLSTVFDPHLADPRTTDVVVNRPGEIGVEKAGRWEWYEEQKLDFDYLQALCLTAAFATGQNVSRATPICTTTLASGERFHICVPPVTDPGLISISIRKPPTFEATLPKLASTGMFADIDAETPSADGVLADMAQGLADKLRNAVRSHKNILICGATGSGKTTLAKSLINEIPSYERLITVEDVPEWRNLPHRNRVALYYSKGQQSAAAVTSQELLQSTLRMRPDRVLVGEVRDAAAFSYLNAIVAGHPGGITTLHANSAKGAFDALQIMIRQHDAGKTMDDKDVKELLYQMVDLVVHCHHDKDANTYRVDDLYEKVA